MLMNELCHHKIKVLSVAVATIDSRPTFLFLSGRTAVLVLRLEF